MLPAKPLGVKKKSLASHPYQPATLTSQSPIIIDMNYSAKLAQRIESVGSRLCVGIDPRPELSGGIDAVPEYLKRIVGETAEYAAAFKPNMAYFEAMGLRGIEMLQDMLQDMPDEVPVILDAKRSDIGETQKYYAKSYFENWNVDAAPLRSSSRAARRHSSTPSAMRPNCCKWL